MVACMVSGHFFASGPNILIEEPGELLQNRAFQAVVPGTLNALNSWQPFNGPRISVTNKTPGVSASLPNSLQVVFPKVVSGPIGVENTGFWGKFA